MRLITAHRILIGAAIAFFLFYAAFQAHRAWSLASASAMVQALVAAVVVVGLILYYRTLRGWGRR